MFVNKMHISQKINGVIMRNLRYIFLYEDEYIRAGKYLFKVTNRNTRTRREICSKLTIKTPERRQ